MKTQLKNRLESSSQVVYLLVLLIIGMSANLYAGVYSGGSGTQADPYKISDANDMNEIGATPGDWGSYFVMTNDIDLSQFTGTQYNVIGTDTVPFTGVFDGNHHSIINFSYSADPATWYIGLFGHVDDADAEVKNLTLIEYNIYTTTNWNTGGLVGRLTNGTVSSCGAINSLMYAHDATGGIVGYADSNGTILNCYNVGGNIDGGGNDYCGGIVGYLKGTVSNCYSTVSVRGSDAIGGLVGLVHNGSISYSYAAGAVTATTSEAGGLVGEEYIGTDGTYESCIWDSTVNPLSPGIGDPNVGGSGESSLNVIAKSTMEMYQEATFTDLGWDFVEVWNIGEKQGYPYLRMHPTGDIDHNDTVNLPDLAILGKHWLEAK